MKFFIWICLSFAILLTGCSKDEEEPLEVPAIVRNVSGESCPHFALQTQGEFQEDYLYDEIPEDLKISGTGVIVKFFLRDDYACRGGFLKVRNIEIISIEKVQHELL